LVRWKIKLILLDLSMSYSINNASAANTLTEQSLKTLNNIAFRADTVALAYTSSEISWLQFMAAQCPYEYGPAVYMARAMLAPVDTTVYANTCENLMDSVNSRSMIDGTENETENEVLLSVLPNPAADQISAGIYSENEEMWNWKIISLDGRSVFASGALATNIYETIDVSNLNNGVYLFSANKENYSLTKRLVIVR